MMQNKSFADNDANRAKTYVEKLTGEKVTAKH